MLRGKFWIDRERCIEVSGSEHAVWARNFLLNWSATTVQGCIGLMTVKEQQQLKFINAKLHKHAVLLYNEADPRVILINRLQFVRTRGNSFYLRDLSRENLLSVAVCTQFWRQQIDWGMSAIDLLVFIGLDGTNRELTFEQFAREYHVAPRLLAQARRNNKKHECGGTRQGSKAAFARPRRVLPYTGPVQLYGEGKKSR